VKHIPHLQRPPSTCLCLVVGRNDRSYPRVLFSRWYTRRGSHNREVTRVKKDVRVNLARCISGDELIPPISLWLSVYPSRFSSPLLPFSLSLFLSLSFSCLLLILFHEMCHPLDPVPPSHTGVLLSKLWLCSLVSRHHRVSLYLWRI